MERDNQLNVSQNNSSKPNSPAKGIIDNISQCSTWKRLLFMVIFVFIYSVAEFVITALVIFQFFSVLLTGERNAQVLMFGKSLSKFIFEIMLFLTFNSEEHPFPFGRWPASENNHTIIIPDKKH